MIFSLFPTPVGHYNIGREFTVKELKLINSLERKQNQGNEVSKEQAVLELKALSSIKTFLHDTVNQFFREVYCPDREVELNITQSWVNHTPKDGFHHSHCHQNSFISGVLYIKADKEKDKIYFFNDDYQMIKIYGKNYNEWNSTSWWLESSTGELLLFPSNLSHGVQTVETDERISLSFNTFPVGLVGGHQYSNSLEVLKIGPGNRE